MLVFFFILFQKGATFHCHQFLLLYKNVSKTFVRFDLTHFSFNSITDKENTENSQNGVEIAVTSQNRWKQRC